MTVIEKLNMINDVIKELFEFVVSDKSTKDDFSEYLSTLGAGNATLSQMEKIFIPYAFERNLGTPSKSVVELFVKSKKTKNIEIAKSLLNSQYSIFRVERILKNGFELFNLTNEKQYTVLSLTKMTNFRGVGIGEFIVARIFKCEDEYYLIGIDNMLPSNKIKDAMRYAVVKIIQSPWLVYEDNSEKEKEIKKYISKMYKKFVSLFEKDEIVTTNRYADTIIGILNDEDKIENLDLEKALEPLKEYKFFDVKELNNTYDNFLENSLGGFSSHTELYDVGIIFDKELGLYSIPFYKTFCSIFEDGTHLENEKDCLEYFLTNDSISDNILKRVFEKYPNFMDRVNEILKTDYTFESLIEKYKSEFLKRKIYSSTSVLYHSTVFSTSLGLIEDEEDKDEQISYQKVGRNEPCPCGSGKKYKNCCLSAQKNP